MYSYRADLPNGQALRVAVKCEGIGAGLGGNKPWRLVVEGRLDSEKNVWGLGLRWLGVTESVYSIFIDIKQLSGSGLRVCAIMMSVLEC